LGCNPTLRVCMLFIELMTTLYLFELVFRDYFKDNTDEDMRKSYLKAVSLAYATAYMSYFLALNVLVFCFQTFPLTRFSVTRFIFAAYISITCTFLASPKWRQELFERVGVLKRQKTRRDTASSRLAKEKRAETEAAIVASTASATVTAMSEAGDDDDDDDAGGVGEGGGSGDIEGGIRLKPILHRLSLFSFNRIATEQ
jgi:hypothetical protein